MHVARKNPTTAVRLLSLGRAPAPYSSIAVQMVSGRKKHLSRAGDNFGGTVSISGDLVAVSSSDASCATTINGDQSNNDCEGAGGVHVFKRTGADWEFDAYIKPENLEAGDGFGRPSIDGNTLVVGARSEGSCSASDKGNNDCEKAGAVYVFTRSAAGQWSEEAYLKASTPIAGQRFGATELNGDTLAVAASGDPSCTTGVSLDDTGADSDCEKAGAIYIFTRSGASWTQQAYIKSSNVDARDGFGRKMSLHGDLLGVGVWSEDSCVGGINGDESNNDCSDQGAVYLFRREGTTWVQTHYLKGTETTKKPEHGDLFGGSISISDTTIVIGAEAETGCGVGVGTTDDDEADCQFSGAAYIYDTF